LTTPGVIIPFKGVTQKSRLSDAMGPKERRSFALAMLRGVLRATKDAGLSSGCMVVSSDDLALKEAARAGAKGVREGENKGVNQAVALGMKSGNALEFMVIPADLPLLTRGDLRAALELAGAGFDVVIAPSRTFDGTNLLWMRRGRGFPLSFDNDSFWNHLRSAAERRLRVVVSSRPGFRFDVDTVADLRELADQPPRIASSSLAREVLRGRAR